MKLSKLNRILSYTSLFLMVYSLTCLALIRTKWYNEIITFYVPFKGIVIDKRQNIIDYFDTPIYVLAFVHFLIYWKKYTFNAKVYFSSVVVYLGFKVLDNYVLFSFNAFVFYNLLILVFVPLAIIIDKKLNR